VIPDQSALRVFAGSYSEYKDARQVQAATPAAESISARRKDETKRQPEGLSKFEQRRRKQRIEAVEAEISKLEDQMAKITRQLENPPPDPVKVQQLGEEYNRLQKKLEERMEMWVEIAG
jgi:ATP-binding cassette, subfamily F, member 3